MIRLSLILAILLLMSLGLPGPAISASMMFDRTQWVTGDMNAQAPADSDGNVSNSHIDDFYYYERIPMSMPLLGDSLGEGSSARTYDSAVLMLVVAADGLSGSDSMRIFGLRLTRPWAENGVSWNYHHASPDSVWDNPGGDFSDLPCMDTIIIDTAFEIGDTLRFHPDTGFIRDLIENNNFGWLMMAENIVDRATFQVYTEDDAVSAHWPALMVFYTEGEANPVWAGRRRRLTAQIKEVIR
jgi:hypothetical protein